MKITYQADAWHHPRNPVKRDWLSLPGLWRFGVHRVLGLRQANPDAHLPGADVGAPVPENPHTLSERMAQCRAALLEANLADTLDAALLERALVLVCDIAVHVLGLTPTRAQRAAVRGMLNQHLVQLAPGEGKTLAIAMVAVILAWRHRPCHVVTANEYLAERDAVLMAPLYAFCDLSVSSVTSKNPSATVGPLYHSHVVYATANQLVADFLRDDLLLDGADSNAERLLWKFRQRTLRAKPVLPGLYAAIIDEADSVLIDEATTPLIISYPEEDRADFLSAVQLANTAAAVLQSRLDYDLLLYPSPSIRFTESGRLKIRRAVGQLSAFWQREERADDLFRTVISAREFFLRDRNYIVRDGEVVIIDPHTGRATPGRHWSNGIHQAVEAKEGLALTVPTKTVARMNFQSFFRRYHLLCGASGTLHGLDTELWLTYGLKVLRVPPNTRSRLSIMPRRVFHSQAEKFAALIDQVVLLNRRGVPVLVGSRRIEDSERIASALARHGLRCTTLNAKLHDVEAEVIACAGQAGTITVATDMAGRGSDIQISASVELLGGLHVLMYESHESARVDWQLYGRAGRQGAQGVAYPFIALDDELFRFLPRPVKKMMSVAYVNFKWEWAARAGLYVAQKRAQSFAMRQRKQLHLVQDELRKRLSFVRDW